MRYGVVFSRRAETYLLRLDKPAQQRFSTAIRALAEDPFGPGTKPLHGIGGRSMRVGNWRVRYSVDSANSLLNIDAIGPRGQVYRER